MSQLSLNDFTNDDAHNPLKLLGIETWLLKSIKKADIKRFLVDMKKILGKYHHPDNFQNQDEKNMHQAYYSRVTSSIDMLLSDG